MEDVAAFLPAEAKGHYLAKGWYTLPQRIAPKVVAAVRGSVERISMTRRPEVVYEQDSTATRAVHGCHRFDDACAKLVRLPVLVDLAELLVGDLVYVYQFKVNFKQAREGREWPWHQDFAFWSIEDGMDAPHAVNIAINLDDVHEGNGPLNVLSGTHRLGLVGRSKDTSDATSGDWRAHVSAELPHTVSNEDVQGLSADFASDLLLGPAGTTTAFHPCVIHSSSNNLSDDRRAVLFITYNSVRNVPRHVHRPEFLVDRDTRPLAKLGGSVGHDPGPWPG